MADTTRLTIDLEVILRNLDRTVRGLDQVQRRLNTLAATRVGATQTRGSNQAVNASQRLAVNQQRLQLQQQRLQQQQQRLTVGTQNLANAQGRATLASQRLALGQQRLAQAQQRLATANTTATRSAITLDQTLGRVGGSLRNLGLGLTSLGASLSVALTAPLIGLGVLATQNAITLDSLNRGLTAIVGSADEAGRQLTRLTQIAKLPGIGFQEAIQGSIRLQAVGFSAEVAERALVQFSNAVALTGGGREELARITVQLGQLSAKGKVLAQDLKPIIEAGPAVGRALLEAFGTVNSEDIQALGLSSREFIGQLLDQLEKLPRAAAGLRNTFDNFTDAVFRSSAAIGEAIIPVLTRFIEIAEPAITKLAAAFKQLPAPVQTLIVLFGGLAAAAGPVFFIFGQFATGVGGLISAFARLNALGLLPTIVNFRLLGQVMLGTASLVQGAAATAAAASVGWAALGIAIIGVIALAAGIAVFVNRQKDAVQISKEQIATTEAQIETLKDQIKFVNSLVGEVERTSEQQDRLTDIYSSLNTQAKLRLTTITDEQQRLAALNEELRQQLQLRGEERIQQTANLAASLAGTIAQIEANDRDRNSITERIKANTQLINILRTGGQVNTEQAAALAAYGDAVAEVDTVIARLNKENELLLERQGGLIKSSRELNGTAEEQAAALRVLGATTREDARELLSLAKAMGVFKGDVEASLPAIEKFIQLQEKAATANDNLRRSLNKAGDDLIKAGERGEEAARRRKAIIEAAATIARETSVDLRGAIKSLGQEVDAVLELRQALERESRLTGKSVQQLITEALTKGTDRGGTSLRSAREQLASAILETAQAQAESELAAQQAGNERLLEANELSYRLQLRSYREYVQARASFTDANLELESRSAIKAIEIARQNEVRLRQTAAKPGIPEGERIKRLTQAERFNEEAIRAGLKLAEIERQREQIAGELKQALAESAVQQLKDVRQLEVEFAELGGRIEDALNTATDERFREALTDLAQTQDFLNKQLERATKARNADLVTQTQTAIQLNQRQIEAINNIITQERALNRLAAANEFVRQQKEKQAELERDLAFQVEFRGLREEDAIAKRLEGERRLADSLAVVRDLVQSTVAALQAQGVEPPRALIDFIRDLKGEIAGLGELSFSEQFGLIEKEFNRLNDERLRRIADVERAVRTRTIAEAEGLLLIRRINGEYSADLEQQVELLRQVAAASNDANLQRSAEDAAQTTKDANAELADFNRQLRSTSIDALRDGLTDFFVSLGDRTRTAKEKLLDLLDSVVGRINQVIAENLSQKLIESLFGDGSETSSGVIASVKRIFGGSVGGGAHETGAAVDITATALQTGATAAATTLTTGAVSASTALVTSLTTAATAFASTIIAAGAAFAASVAASGAAQAVGGLGGSFGGFAATGLFPAVPGGVYKFIEGGHPEAVLTTDPKYATQQVAILKQFLAHTRGLGGRIKGLATGGFISPHEVDSALLGHIPSMSAPQSNIGSLAVAGAPSMVKLRQILVDQRDMGNWVASSEGERVLVDFLHKNQPTVRKLAGR